MLGFWIRITETHFTRLRQASRHRHTSPFF